MISSQLNFSRVLHRHAIDRSCMLQTQFHRYSIDTKRLTSNPFGCRVTELGLRRSKGVGKFKRVKALKDIDMEVTKETFEDALPIVEEALKECQFYSFDCEMTGLFVSDRKGLADGKPPSYLHDMEDRYEELLQSSESFVINQFGLSTFIWDGTSYSAKTFNFYTFPRSFEEYQPRFLSEAKSLEFLSEHHFDFNKWIYKGIPYMPGSLRDKKLQMVDIPPRRNEIVPMAEEDKMLVADLRMTVRKWLQDDSSKELLLSPVNSFQRALQYQELRKDQFGFNDPPGFYTEKVEAENGRAMIKLVRASSNEVQKREQEGLETRRRSIINASGFSRVLDVMRNCGKPAIGHNLAFDVAFSIHSFVTPLPPSWEEFRQLVQWQFPGGIFDTKLVATKLFADSLEPIETSLETLYTLLTVGDVVSEETKAQVEAACVTPRNDFVTHADGYEKYKSVPPGELAHEAGYDAFMTGTVFACLVAHAAKMHERGEEDQEEGEIDSANFDVIQSMAYKMYVTQSDMEFAAFAGAEDVPERLHILYIKDIPQAQQIRRGNDLARNLSKQGLSGVRVTTLEYGSKALIEFPDAQTAMNTGMPLLAEMFKDASVLEYSAFREDLRRKRNILIEKRQKRGTNGVISPNHKKQKLNSADDGTSNNTGVANIQCSMM